MEFSSNLSQYEDGTDVLIMQITTAAKFDSSREMYVTCYVYAIQQNEHLGLTSSNPFKNDNCDIYTITHKGVHYRFSDTIPEHGGATEFSTHNLAN
ncbi:hypothetical protein J6590_087391, partial [Homalodisca vitripennis]